LRSGNRRRSWRLDSRKEEPRSPPKHAADDARRASLALRLLDGVEDAAPHPLEVAAGLELGVGQRVLGADVLAAAPLSIRWTSTSSVSHSSQCTVGIPGAAPSPVFLSVSESTAFGPQSAFAVACRTASSNADVSIRVDIPTGWWIHTSGVPRVLADRLHEPFAISTLVRIESSAFFANV